MVYQRLMEQTAASRAMPMSLPNVLTYVRIAAVPALVACLFFLRGDVARWSAFSLFVFAGLTDWLDGYLARIWEQQSTLGRMLDPIADKLLVGAVLMMLVQDGTISGWSIWAAIIILCREILVSGLREFLAELRVSVPVSKLAKFKTAAQMTAIFFLLLGPVHVAGFAILAIGNWLLWMAALLTLITGYAYLKTGLKHMTEP